MTVHDHDGVSHHGPDHDPDTDPNPERSEAATPRHRLDHGHGHDHGHGAMRAGERHKGRLFLAFCILADAVLIGRPYPVMFYGGEEEGVHLFNKKIGAEFRESMMMTASKTRADINTSKLFFG